LELSDRRNSFNNIPSKFNIQNEGLEDYDEEESP
jgi:hypothetical protein